MNNISVETIEKLRVEMVGKRYRHFKGKIYVVIDIAVHTETDEIMVVYKRFLDSLVTWCRPLEMFMSDVDHKKYPDVKQKKRFERMYTEDETI